MIEPDIAINLETFWNEFISQEIKLNGTLVSAESLFDGIKLGEWRNSLESFIEGHNVFDGREIITLFKGEIESSVSEENKYSHSEMVEKDKLLTDSLHLSIPKIIQNNPRFLDQLRSLHYRGMAGNEDLMLYPSQTKRLRREGIDSIAGEIRTIPVGFGDFRFNAPREDHLPFLLDTFCEKVEILMKDVNSDNIYYFVSFAQYYFALLHPFYERCGRTSEDLIYLLFEQTQRDKIKYISKTGWRESPLAKERTNKINEAVENFNKKIGKNLGIDIEKVRRTPDILEGITKKYFSDKYEDIYSLHRERPFYYNHPISQVMDMYYLVMESNLFDEIQNFNLIDIPHHIMELGEHLKVKGHKGYTYQKENRITTLSA